MSQLVKNSRRKKLEVLNEGTWELYNLQVVVRNSELVIIIILAGISIIVNSFIIVAIAILVFIN
jgi:hypothetical protein